MKQKGFSGILLVMLVGILLVPGVIAGVYYYNTNQETAVKDFDIVTTQTPIVSPPPLSRSFPKDDKVTINEIKQLFPKFDWNEATNSADVPSHGILKGQGIMGTITLDSIDAIRKIFLDEKYLETNDWQEDNSQTADGVTGSVWGYLRESGDKIQVLSFSREMNSEDAKKMFEARENLTEFKCPCRYNMKIFLSDWFIQK